MYMTIICMYVSSSIISGCLKLLLTQYFNIETNIAKEKVRILRPGSSMSVIEDLDNGQQQKSKD